MALAVKNLLANTGYIRDVGLIPGLGRSLGMRGVHKQGKCLALCMPIVQSQYTVIIIIIFPFSF